VETHETLHPPMHWSTSLRIRRSAKAMVAVPMVLTTCLGRNTTTLRMNFVLRWVKAQNQPTMNMLPFAKSTVSRVSGTRSTSECRRRVTSALGTRFRTEPHSQLCALNNTSSSSLHFPHPRRLSREAWEKNRTRFGEREPLIHLAGRTRRLRPLCRRCASNL
jgi:hypothetical protein